MSTLRNPNQPDLAEPTSALANGLASATSVPEAGNRIHAMEGHAEQSLLGKGLILKGTVSGIGALHVEGQVVGNINLPENRVVIGAAGQISDGLSVCIHAREVVVMGKVRGNILATERVEIRAEGELTGNVTTGRISIADGAFFKGDVDLRTARRRQEAPEANEAPRQAQA